VQFQQRLDREPLVGILSASRHVAADSKSLTCGRFDASIM
jgi:hypothetical protein